MHVSGLCVNFLRMMQETQDLPSLSPALENYLTIIFRQEYENGACRASDIAHEAKVTRSSVTSALRVLTRMGYITYSPYKLIHLTEQGKDLARKLWHRKMVLQDFLTSVLHVSTDVATANACDIEHVISDDALMRLQQFLLYLRHCAPEMLEWHTKYEEKREFLLTKIHGNKAHSS